MIELMIKLNPRFTKEDREACVPTVEKMVGMSETVRSRGMLALEDEMQAEENTFLRAVMPFVLDACDPEDVEKIMSSLIVSGGHSGAELLSRLIMAQGIISLQKWHQYRFYALTAAVHAGRGVPAERKG